MPLDSDNEPACRVFYGLDDPIGGERNRAEIAPWILNGLMMIAVNFNLRSARKPGNEATLGDMNHMARGRLAIVLIVSLVVRN